MCRHGTRVRRHGLGPVRSAVQDAVARAGALCQAADRRETRRVGALPLRRLDARAADAQGLLGSRDLQEPGFGRAARAGEPLDHVQRLLSGHRRHDVHLLVQGDRSLFGLRPRRGGRTARAGGGVGRKYGPCLRQGLLGQRHPPAAVGSLRQYRRALVRGAAEPLCQADLLRRGRRLFRCHLPERSRAQRSRVLCRGRREKHRPARRHGLHGAVGRDGDRPHPRLLFSGRGQRDGRHRGVGGQSAPRRGRPFRAEHHEADGVAERAVRPHVRRLAGRFARDAAL